MLLLLTAAAPFWPPPTDLPSLHNPFLFFSFFPPQFIEYRNGMLNVSPIGRACSRSERNDFEAWDKQSKCRETMVSVLEKEFGERFRLKFSIGGQISFDVFPVGWDKTYCLQFLNNGFDGKEGENDSFDEIHFFGDKTYEGGNDFEIYQSDKTIGHAVTSPEDTMAQCRELFKCWLKILK